MISLACKYSIPLEEITNKLIGIGGKNAVGFGNSRVLSVPDAVGKALAEAQKNSETKESCADKPAEHAKVSFTGDLCPQCGGKLIKVGNCPKCSDPACAYSKC